MKKIITFSVYLAYICVHMSIPSSLFAENTKQSSSRQYKEQHYKQHLLLIRGSYLDRIKNNYRELINEAVTKKFLTKKASESDNPLAPCTLLSNAFVSSYFDYNVRYKIVMENEFPALPRGTNTFGKYDDIVTENIFFEQSPEIQADILARLHILISGNIDTVVNSFIHELSQLQCLDHLVNPELDSLGKQLWGQSKLKMMPHGALHYAAVEMLGSTYTPKQIVKYIKEVEDPKTLELPGTENNNPLMPCSLLRAYMSARGISGLWDSIVGGKVFIPSEKANFLGKYRDLVLDGRIPTDDKVVATKITALYFTNSIIYSDRVSNKMIHQSNQQECLEEIINPREAR